MARVIRVSVFGAVTVSCDDLQVSGRALGGRRARLALVALATADGPMPADRLAAIIWAEQQPPTWQAALRGVIRSLRGALASAGAEGAIVTTPAGYALAPEVEVDLAEAAASLRAASALAEQGRHEAVVQAAEPVAQLSGEQLLPGEDASWLEGHRTQADAVALEALDLVARSAGALGDHHRAVDAGRRAVSASPLDERAHRIVIRALHRAGDRAGVVLAFEACRTILADQLGVDPAPETVELYLTAIGASGTSGMARLPQQGLAFFGREAEVAELTAAIADPGLATVAGPGGVGKSRLALQVATPADFPGGKSWVSLASVSQDELVASMTAMTLGLPVGTEDPASLLGAHFAPIGRALLVLDGCEAVVDGTASLVTSLLTLCPTLSVLVTSRRPLGVEAERVISVDPLPFPELADLGPAKLAESVQVRLLVDRARHGGGQLLVDESTIPFVAELCRRCGGLPLALELTAAQLAAMSVPDLLDHLPVLVADGQDWLRGIAETSYELLDHDEALVFRRFSVLDGQVTLPLIKEVVADETVPPVRIVRILRELTARGLLTVDRSGPRWRYHQDDDLHRLARELLETRGEAVAMTGRLADVVMSIVPHEPTTPPEPYLEPIGEVLPQIRSLLGAAIDGALPIGTGLELGFRLHRYWAATNVAEGRFWLSRLLASVPPDHDQPLLPAHAAYALGYLSYWSGDTAAAVRELEQAVQLLAGHSDVFTARALIYLAGLLDDMDRGDESLDVVRQAIEAARPFGVNLQVGAAIGMGCVLAERAEPSAAAYAADAIELCRAAGTPAQLAATLPTAATVCWQVGDLARARAYIAEAMPLLGDSRRIARVVLMTAAAGVALADGDHATAVELATIADTDATDLGIERELPLVRSVRARALLATGDVAAAGAKAIDAIVAARSLTFAFPMATCLETAALVRLADERLARTLLDTAAVIRERGQRPGPVALGEAVAQARVSVGADGDSAAEFGTAVDLALAALRSTATVSRVRALRRHGVTRSR